MISQASKRARVTLGAILALALPAWSQTTTIYDSSGFELLVPEQDLTGQDPAQPIGNGPWQKDIGTSTAVVTVINPVEDTKSVKITRNPGATGNTRWGVVKPVVPSGINNIVDIRFDMLLKQQTNDFGPMFGVEAYDQILGQPKLIASLLVDSSNGELVYRKAVTGEFIGSGHFIHLARHQHYRLSLDFAEKTYSLYVNGSEVHTEGFVDPLGSSFYDAPLVTLSNGIEDHEGSASIDNYIVEQTTSQLPYLLWQGDDSSNTWSIGGASLWNDGISSVPYENGNEVRFDDTGSNSPAVDIQGSLEPTSITVDAAQDYQFSGSGSIDGIGSLTKDGNGILILAGGNGYTGDTNIWGGELKITNSSGSATGSGMVSVFPPSTISGNGSVGGSLLIGSGAILEPGDEGVGILAVGADLVVDDSILRFELGSGNDLVTVVGDLTLGGRLEIIDAGGFGPGTYPLITYGGTLTDGTSLLVTSAPEDLGYEVSTATPGTIELIVTLPPTIPSDPTNLAATSTGSSSIDLNWDDNSANESSFVIERAISGETFNSLTSVSADETSFSDTGLTPGTAYDYRIKAVNAGGDSGFSNVASATTDTSPAIAHYEYELNTLDSTGNNNHGIPVGTLLYDPGVQGDYAATFDGSAFVEITRVVENSFTIMMWVKTTSAGGGGAWYNGMGLVDGEMVGSAADWGCSVSGSKFAFGVGAPDTTISSNKSINDGAWHHVAATYNTSTGEVSIYVDGVFDKSDSAPTGARTAPTQLRIGATQTTSPNFFTGSMDDLKFFPGILNESEINDASGLSGPPPLGDPVVIYPLGDSITWGYSTGSLADTPGGYREALYRNLLLNWDQTPQFVGANISNTGPIIDRDGQINHDGYPQYTINEISLNLDTNHWTGKTRGNNGGFWLTGGGVRPAIEPDIILLLAGTNDIEDGTDATTIESRMDAMLEKVFTLRPNTKIFLASIPPYPADAVKTATAKVYNQLMLTGTIPKHLSMGRNIRFVDQYPNFVLVSDPAGDTINASLYGDTIHPNATGYQLMGDTWAEAVLADPVPLPASPSTLAYSLITPGTVELTWTDNSDNEGAFLIERSTNGVDFSVIDYVGQNVTSFTDSGLDSLRAYTYRVVARNSSGDSDYSNSETTPGGFDAWATYKFTPAELLDPLLSGPQADFDGDGMLNLVEYAFDGNPKIFDHEILPTIDQAGGYLHLTFIRLLDRTDINYTVQSGQNLDDFSVVAESLLGANTVAVNGGAVTTTPDPSDANKETVEARDNVSMSGASRRFMRVRIEQD